MTTRRSFLQTSAVIAGAMGGLPKQLLASPVAAATKQAATSLRVLVLGGSGFTGAAMVEHALARGHHVTVFTRGRTALERSSRDGVEERVGDLAGNTSALRGRAFDVVFDNASARPAWVHNAARALRGAVGQYVFLSAAQAAGEEIGAALAPALAGELEQAVRQAWAGRAAIVRPGLVVGPHERSAWFSDWVARVEQGGEIQVPCLPEQACRIVDVRDLAAFSLRLAEHRAYGDFDLDGPVQTMDELLYGVKAVTSTPGTLSWPPLFLRSEVRLAQRLASGTQRVDAAARLGFAYRPVAETARATLAWQRGQQA